MRDGGLVALHVVRDAGFADRVQLRHLGLDTDLAELPVRFAALQELLHLHRLGRRRGDSGPPQDHDGEGGRKRAHHAGISGPGLLRYWVVIAFADQ